MRKVAKLLALLLINSLGLLQRLLNIFSRIDFAVFWGWDVHGILFVGFVAFVQVRVEDVGEGSVGRRLLRCCRSSSSGGIEVRGPWKEKKKTG